MAGEQAGETLGEVASALDRDGLRPSVGDHRRIVGDQRLLDGCDVRRDGRVRDTANRAPDDSKQPQRRVLVAEQLEHLGPGGRGDHVLRRVRAVAQTKGTQDPRELLGREPGALCELVGRQVVAGGEQRLGRDLPEAFLTDGVGDGVGIDALLFEERDELTFGFRVDRGPPGADLVHCSRLSRLPPPCATCRRALGRVLSC